MLVVAPLAADRLRALGARGRAPPRRASPLVAVRDAVPFTRGELERDVAVLERWLARADVVRQTSRSGACSRGSRRTSAARADRARRRGALPRLGRRRLDLPPPGARASSATASPRCMSTTASAARSPTPTRASAPGARSRGRPRRRRGPDGGGAPRRSATRRRPDRLARRATRRATRSRRSSTGSSRAGTTKGIKPRREDGVVRPLLPLWREETEAFCRERGVAFRSTPRTPARRAG